MATEEQDNKPLSETDIGVLWSLEARLDYGNSIVTRDADSAILRRGITELLALREQLKTATARADIYKTALQFYATPSNLEQFVVTADNPFKGTSWGELDDSISDRAIAALAPTPSTAPAPVDIINAKPVSLEPDYEALAVDKIAEWKLNVVGKVWDICALPEPMAHLIGTLNIVDLDDPLAVPAVAQWLRSQKEPK